MMKASSAGKIVEISQEPTCEEKHRQISAEDVLSDCSTTCGNTDPIRNCENCSDCSSSDVGDVETLIIFDFDDTLFPTSWLQGQGLFCAEAVLSEDQEDQLRMLGERTLPMLHMAMRLGKVVIVTNAMDGWVETCFAKMMPSLVQVFDKIKVVSARSKYEEQSADPSEWKRLAFEFEVELLEFAGAIQFNVVSLGDSLHEQLAVQSLSEKRAPSCHGKSVKFLPAPTIDQLRAEHDFVVLTLLDVVQHSGNLDVEIAP
jgi:hypothetical protein